MSRSNNWCFTINNYTEDEVATLEAIVDSEKAVYVCFQEEVGLENGTPHIQGYISCNSRVRLTGVKKLIGTRAHAILANGSPSSNRTYCSKEETGVEGTFKEYGQLPPDPKTNQGQRTDFDEFIAAVDGGLRCKRKARMDFPGLVAKYPRWCYDIIADQTTIQNVEHDTLYEWQGDLEKVLSAAPPEREIIFFVDTVGNSGKTWFAKDYCKRNEDAQYMEPGKKADMAYALQDDLRVLFLNVTRTTDESTQHYLYSFLESVKDGMVFSPKYESRMKYFGSVHVCVMMNQGPNMELLSPDRYMVTKIS